MTKSDIINEIDKARTEFLLRLTILTDKLNCMEVELPRHWLPKQDEIYYSVYGDSVQRCQNHCKERSNGLYSLGNIFKTEAEANRFKEYLMVMAELRRYAEEKNKGDKYTADGKKHWYCITRKREELEVDTWLTYYVGLPLFKSEKDAQSAIDHFGDRLHIVFDYNL